MPRAPRLYAPEATVHVVARCNNREFYFTTPEDFAAVLGKLRGMVRNHHPSLYAYALMSPKGVWYLSHKVDEGWRETTASTAVAAPIPSEIR
jgi:hypothetical protein